MPITSGMTNQNAINIILPLYKEGRFTPQPLRKDIWAMCFMLLKWLYGAWDRITIMYVAKRDFIAF